MVLAVGHPDLRRGANLRATSKAEKAASAVLATTVLRDAEPDTVRPDLAGEGTDQ